MHRLLDACKTCFPVFVAIVGIIAFFYLFYFLIKKQPKIFWTVIITAIIVSIITLMTDRFIFPKLFRMFSLACGGQEVSERWIIYDTDPRNDTFIKGRLRYGELLILDRILMKEKSNNGLRLDSTTLNEAAKYDPKIIDAYDRWRKCKDMRRSYHRSIYPDERELYHYLRE
ncbi:hypothetical protein EH223_18280 [candidate division KSB1 bacterium]|nr:hypothetical protein [candidate division KSB1 bacterium]RQW00692.1 MAG: hypothetical protein EH223_18280 [candidate division KSB1 bacterium]